MTNVESTPAGAALVAVDVAKLRNEVLIEMPGARRRRRLTVTNTRAEHDRLVAELQALARPVTVGFEPTGHYHRPLAWRLVQAGFDVRLVSSVALARTREALHNGWDKNDPKDAQVILHMLRIGAAKPYHDPLAHGINDIQELSMTHEAVSKAKTEVLHRIQTHYLPLYFPEAERFLNSTRSEWFFAFLDRFPVPAAITALGKEAFVEAAWHVVGRKVSKARLLGDIYETARTSIALPIAPDAPAVAMFRLGSPAPDPATGCHRGSGERAARGARRFPPSAADPGHRADQRARYPRRGRRPPPLRPPPPVPEVLRPRPRHPPVRPVPRQDQAVQAWQRTPAPDALDGRPGRHPPAGERLPRQVRALRRQGSAGSGPAAQGVHRDHRQDGARGARAHQGRCRLPAVRRAAGARWRNPSLSEP